MANGSFNRRRAVAVLAVIALLVQTCTAYSEWPRFSSHASLVNVRIRQERPLLARLFIPPFRHSQTVAPAALLLPGAPGVDSWEDLAYALRDAGVHTLVVMHSGTQLASEGFSCERALDDAMEAYNWLTNCSTVDKQRIAVVGNELASNLAMRVMEEMWRLHGNNQSEHRTVALINPVLVGSEAARLSERRLEEAKTWIGLAGQDVEREWKELVIGGRLQSSCGDRNMTLQTKQISTGGRGQKGKKEARYRGLVLLTSHERPSLLRRIFPKPLPGRREFYRNLKSMEELSHVDFKVRRYFLGHSTRQTVLRSLVAFICDALSHDSFNYGEKKMSRFIKTTVHFQIAACLNMAVGYLAWGLGALTVRGGVAEPKPTIIDPSITKE